MVNLFSFLWNMIMRKLIVFMLFTLVTFTWGTTWMAMKIAVDTIPPIFATGLRFLCAAPVLLSIAWATKTPLLFPSGQRGFQVIVCLFYFAIPFTLTIYGEQFVGSGLASIMFANMPVAVLVASLFFLKEKAHFLQIVGLTLSVTALSYILFQESQTEAQSNLFGILSLVLAVIMHACMYAQCKKRACQVAVVTFNALPCLGAGVILSILGWYAEKPHVQYFSMASLWAVMYLGPFAGIFGILCYFALQQKAGVFQASIAFLIFPLIALSFENLVYGHTLSNRSMISVVPLIFGILLTLIPKKHLRIH